MPWKASTLRLERVRRDSCRRPGPGDALGEEALGAGGSGGGDQVARCPRRGSGAFDVAARAISAASSGRSVSWCMTRSGREVDDRVAQRPRVVDVDHDGSAPSPRTSSAFSVGARRPRHRVARLDQQRRQLAARSPRSRRRGRPLATVIRHHLFEGHPGRVAAQRDLELFAGHGGDAAGPVELRFDDPRRVAGLRDHDLFQLPVEQAGELFADFRAAEFQRPFVQRAEVVVGIGDADQVGDRGAEDVLDALRFAARAGGEQRLGDVALRTSAPGPRSVPRLRWRSCTPIRGLCRPGCGCRSRGRSRRLRGRR